MAAKAKYSSTPSTAMTETENKKLKKIEKAENNKLKINKAEKKKHKKIVKAKSQSNGNLKLIFT